MGLPLSSSYTQTKVIRTVLTFVPLSNLSFDWTNCAYSIYLLLLLCDQIQVPLQYYISFNVLFNNSYASIMIILFCSTGTIP